MTTDQTIEQEIKDAPRITSADIAAAIDSEHYFTAAQGDRQAQEDQHEGRSAVLKVLGQITVCVLVLRNGHRIVGVNEGPVSPENFDADLGRQYARQKAVDQIWPLLGYALRERLHADGPMNWNKMDRIARVAHEVNRGYCQALGDDSQPTWENAPAWQRESARMGADLHMSGDFGAEASHISWMRQKLDDGWVYGEVKDAAQKTHPCIRPFAELPPEQQAKDHIFRAVIHALR